MYMKAMIFAAGLGTRLKPITDTLPKALVPVCGRPLLEHVSRKLLAAGINETVINVHHFADLIEEWIAGQDWISTSKEDMKSGNMIMQVSDERARLLETGGAVLHARRYLEGCGHFLIHNVDILSDCDIEEFVSRCRPEALASLLVSERETSRFLLFHPETDRLVGWSNVNTGDHCLVDPSLEMGECKALGFSGIHLVSDKVLDLMARYVHERGISDDDGHGARFAIMNFYMWAASKYPIYGVKAEKLNFLDVGKLDALEPAERFIEQNDLYKRI